MARWQRGQRRGDAPEDGIGDGLEAPAEAPGATAVDVRVPEPDEEPHDADEPAPSGRGRMRTTLANAGPLLLLQAAHPRQALVTGLGLGVAALASDRPLREAAVVAATGLVGQAVLGWHNDVVDRERDARHDTPRKPVADGRVEAGTAWFALVIGVLLVIPLSISVGVTAGSYFLGALVAGLLGNVVLRRGRLSWLSWAAQFALFVPYLSYGGWGGDAEGSPPEVAMVALGALLGVGIHFLRAIWGLVADDAEGWTYLPLALGRRLGASRLLAVSATWTGLVLAAIVIVGATLGLRQ